MLKNPRCLDPMPDNLFYPPKKGDYIYFEGTRYTAGTSLQPDAAWAADAAMLAYVRYGSTRMPEEDFTGVLRGAGFTQIDTIGDCFVDHARTARGYFATNESYGLLAFRGTEKGNASDTAADADAILIPGDGGRVHQGFHQYLQTIWPRAAQLVQAYRQDHPKQDICITGHSLGAALASLAFVSLNDPATSLYTFGCPRVGDHALCDRIVSAAASRRCYRIVDNQDFVTHVPLTTAPFPYEHPDITLLWVDGGHVVVKNPKEVPDDWKDFTHLAFGFLQGHWFDFLPVPLPPPLADHSPVRYCHWISQASEL